MALEHLADLLHSWKAYLDSPAPGPNQIEAVFYTIVVNSPMFSGASGNEVSYISGVFTQYTTAPLTFSGGTLKVMALYSDKQDEATGQPFDIKQSDEVAVTLADAVLGSQGETTQLPTISAGQHV